MPVMSRPLNWMVPRVGWQERGQQVEARGLAGAVRARSARGSCRFARAASTPLTATKPPNSRVSPRSPGWCLSPPDVSLLSSIAGVLCISAGGGTRSIAQLPAGHLSGRQCRGHAGELGTRAIRPGHDDRAGHLGAAPNFAGGQARRWSRARSRPGSAAAALCCSGAAISARATSSRIRRSPPPIGPRKVPPRRGRRMVARVPLARTGRADRRRQRQKLRHRGGIARVRRPTQAAHRRRRAAAAGGRQRQRPGPHLVRERGDRLARPARAGGQSDDRVPQLQPRAERQLRAGFLGRNRAAQHAAAGTRCSAASTSRPWR